MVHLDVGPGVLHEALDGRATAANHLPYQINISVAAQQSQTERENNFS
jgi:hypothetical protein